MTFTHRQRPTAMFVCDICDEEIEAEADGSAGRANLMARVSPIAQVTDQTRHGILCWGRRRVRSEDDPMPTASYDFHGRCIARLIEVTVAARKAGDA